MHIYICICIYICIYLCLYVNMCTSAYFLQPIAVVAFSGKDFVCVDIAERYSQLKLNSMVTVGPFTHEL